MKSRACLFFVFALLVASLRMPTALHAQSLGEVAKKAQEQRDKAKADAAAKTKTEGEQAKSGGASTNKPSAAPTKAYTNKDLVDDPTMPAAAPAQTKTERAVNETSDKTATEKSDKPVKDEAYWRARMTTLRGDLARDKAACEPLAEKVRALDRIYADSVFLRGWKSHGQPCVCRRHRNEASRCQGRTAAMCREGRA